MSRSRPLFATFAVALVAPVLAVTASAPAAGTSQPAAAAVSSADLSSALAPRVRQRAKLLMHPQLADASGRARAAKKAKSSMTGVFKPREKGRVVQLQKKQGKRWSTIQKRRQSGKGQVEFNAPYKKKGKIQTYRVVATKHQGMPAKASKGVRTDKWGGSDFRDEFSGTTLNTALWSPRGQAYAPESRRKCSKGDMRAAKVSGGALRLSVMVNPDELLKCDASYVYNGRSVDYGDHAYRLNGHIGTQGKVEVSHGYAAARIKFQPQAGQHAAFWMRPGSGNNEIDVIEWFGDRKNNDTELTSFVYNNNDTFGGLLKDTHRYGKDWASKYHVFSVEWTPRKYTFRIDGKQTFSTKKGNSSDEHFLILSLLSSDYELSKSKSLPQHMYVDWVQYWER